MVTIKNLEELEKFKKINGNVVELTFFDDVEIQCGIPNKSQYNFFGENAPEDYVVKIKAGNIKFMNFAEIDEIVCENLQAYGVITCQQLKATGKINGVIFNTDYIEADKLNCTILKTNKINIRFVKLMSITVGNWSSEKVIANNVFNSNLI